MSNGIWLENTSRGHSNRLTVTELKDETNELLVIGDFGGMSFSFRIHPIDAEALIGCLKNSIANVIDRQEANEERQLAIMMNFIPDEA